METKSLYIIRHAKAEEHTAVDKDFQRNLIDKGRTRAQQIAVQLKEHLPVVDKNTLVISSTANRAAQTAKIFCTALGIPEEQIIWEPKVYEASYLTLLKRINSIPDTYRNVLLFGHNPGVSDLSSYLTDKYISLKTSAVAIVELQDNWTYAQLSENTASLKAILESKREDLNT